MAINFSLSQMKLPADVRKASRPGRGRSPRRGLFSGSRAAEPMVELTVRRRPARGTMENPLAERIYRNANPAETVRVPLADKGRVRRELDRAGYRVESERRVRR